MLLTLINVLEAKIISADAGAGEEELLQEYWANNSHPRFIETRKQTHKCHFEGKQL